MIGEDVELWIERKKSQACLECHMKTRDDLAKKMEEELEDFDQAFEAGKRHYPQHIDEISQIHQEKRCAMQQVNDTALRKIDRRLADFMAQLGMSA